MINIIYRRKNPNADVMMCHARSQLWWKMVKNNNNNNAGYGWTGVPLSTLADGVFISERERIYIRIYKCTRAVQWRHRLNTIKHVFRFLNVFWKIYSYEHKPREWSDIVNIFAVLHLREKMIVNIPPIIFIISSSWI